MNLNYTSICHYCGAIYKSNRSTSIYCSKQHNSLYHANGSQIDYGFLNSRGEYVNYHEILSHIYGKARFFEKLNQEDLYGEALFNQGYYGPLPKGNELLLVSGFIIRKLFTPRTAILYYAIKPMELLTKHEKATCAIKVPNIDIHASDQEGSPKISAM